MENKNYSRRKFFNTILGTGSLLFGGALFLNSCNTNESSGGETKSGSDNKKQSTSADPCNDLTGVSDGEIKKRESLGYVTKSADPENHCSNCALYIPPAGEGACGGCILFKGPVYAEGHCVQWAAKTT